FDDPIIRILLAAALLSILVETFKLSAAAGGVALAGLAVAVVALVALRRREGIPVLLFGTALVLGGFGLSRGHLFAEGLAVMVAVVLATGGAFLSEDRSDREFEILNARKESLHAKVLRGGEVHSVPLEGVA